RLFAVYRNRMLVATITPHQSPAATASPPGEAPLSPPNSNLSDCFLNETTLRFTISRLTKTDAAAIIHYVFLCREVFVVGKL
ncbi:MAG: hypothetical protein IKS52_07180, partial [Clostridia bacterium]|nr:hypothetical protein [Clostridia bacterium]